MREIQGTPSLRQVRQGVKKCVVWDTEALRRAVGQRESGLGGCELVEVSAPVVSGHKSVVDKTV